MGKDIDTRNFKIGPVQKVELSGEGINEQGFLRFELIDVHRWEYTQKDFLEERGIKLPEKKYLKRFGRTKDLVLLLETLLITVTFKNTSWIQLKLMPGFICDLGSVPSFMRGLIESRDIDCLVAWLFHDVNYSVHIFDRKKSDRLMYEMIKIRAPRPDDTGLSVKARACLSYAAVRIGGRRRWKANQAKRAEWTEKTIAFEASRV